MSNFMVNKSFNNRNNGNGRAFALASGFIGAMGSGSAIASGSTAAFVDNLKIQAARPKRINPIAPRVFPRRSILQRPILKNRQLNLNTTLPIATAAPLLPIAHVAGVPLNQDPNPIIIRKKPIQPVNYTQQISVKFLQPPPPQQPGDIVITQQKDVQAPPAPPHLIRQKTPLPVKPAPLVVRERPPLPPAPIPPEHHVIPGKVIPPPPRKVIIERLPQLPQPPQDIIVERWLEYPQRTRRVVFRPAPKLIPLPPPKNVLIQWESPAVALNRQFRNLGVSPAHPVQYASTFGPTLVHPSAIPTLARAIKPTNGQRLAAESLPKPVRLFGDVAALNLVRHNTSLAKINGLAASTSIAPTLKYRNSITPIISTNKYALSNAIPYGSRSMVGLRSFAA